MGRLAEVQREAAAAALLLERGGAAEEERAAAVGLAQAAEAAREALEARYRGEAAMEAGRKSLVYPPEYR